MSSLMEQIPPYPGSLSGNAMTPPLHLRGRPSPGSPGIGPFQRLTSMLGGSRLLMNSGA
jgi:hypothetical protein